MTKERDPIEVAARALCQFHGLPENTQFEGKPMWQSYRAEAEAIVKALEKAGAIGNKDH